MVWEGLGGLILTDWVSEWLTEWVSDIADSRDAYASKKSMIIVVPSSDWLTAWSSTLGPTEMAETSMLIYILLQKYWQTVYKSSVYSFHNKTVNAW